MLSISHLFEQGTFKQGMKTAGKSMLSGTGLALKGTGQAVSATGESLHNRFSKDDNKKQKEDQEEEEKEEKKWTFRRCQ